jgi:hypothetical protein
MRRICHTGMDDRRITDLTVGELEEIIKRTVKKSVAEVMIEFAMEADIEAQIAYEAELNDMLRNEMQAYGKVHVTDMDTMPKADD